MNSPVDEPSPMFHCKYVEEAMMWHVEKAGDLYCETGNEYMARMIVNALNTRAESPDSVEEAGQSRSTDAPEATGDELKLCPSTYFEDIRDRLDGMPQDGDVEYVRRKLRVIESFLSTPKREAPTQAEEQIGNALLSAKGLIEKLYSLVSHNPAMGRATSITINELDNAIDALFSLQPSKGVWVSRESAEVLAKFLPDDCYTNTPVGNAFKELKQSLERKNGQ